VDKSIERRNSQRFEIGLPLSIRWTDGAEHYCAGESVNISRGGMFILAEQGPRHGLEVNVEVVVPASDLVPRAVRLRCIGRVRRVEMCYPLTGFAIAGQFVDESQGKIGFW
jgi:c-di-GMP-binding flagellar brake protein YcgR